MLLMIAGFDQHVNLYFPQLIKMAKGKGRQAGGFASKSMRAQFHAEWQSNVAEDTWERRRTNKSRAKTTSSLVHKERPRLRLTSLRHMLEERQLEDREEHKMIRQKKSTTIARNNHQSAPGSVVYHYDEDYGKELRPHVLSLQSLCLQTLAPHLPRYLQILGEETLHYYLSLLTGPALTALSVYISQTVGMTDSLVGLLNQTHVTRLSITAPKNDEETDRHWKALTQTGLEALVPTWGQTETAFLPDDWENYDSDCDDQDILQWKGCRRLERLELNNLTHLTADCISELLSTCSSITHLGLSGSCTYESGPEILWKVADWLPQLIFIDLSGCTWVTEALLRQLFSIYNERYPQVLQIRAVSCMAQTSQVSLEMEYGNQFLTN